MRLLAIYWGDSYMPEKKETNTETFGAFIRNIRKKDERFRQKDVADKLGMSLSYYSAIENDDRRPLNGEEMEIFAKLFYLTKEEKTIMYDLANNGTNITASDLEYLRDEKKGKWARIALRKASKANADEKFWRKIIWDLEKQENQDEQGGDDE